MQSWSSCCEHVVWLGSWWLAGAIGRRAGYSNADNNNTAAGAVARIIGITMRWWNESESAGVVVIANAVTYCCNIKDTSIKGGRGGVYNSPGSPLTCLSLDLLNFSFALACLWEHDCQVPKVHRAIKLSWMIFSRYQQYVVADHRVVVNHFKLYHWCCGFEVVDLTNIRKRTSKLILFVSWQRTFQDKEILLSWIWMYAEETKSKTKSKVTGKSWGPLQKTNR